MEFGRSFEETTRRFGKRCVKGVKIEFFRVFLGFGVVGDGRRQRRHWVLGMHSGGDELFEDSGFCLYK